jgi:hypothetical protein
MQDKTTQLIQVLTLPELKAMEFSMRRNVASGQESVFSDNPEETLTLLGQRISELECEMQN